MSNISKEIINLFSWETLNSEKFNFWLIFAIILFCFIPVKYVFITKEAYLLGQYSDYTAITLYLSQIFLLLYSALYFIKFKSYLPKTGLIKGVFTLLLIFLLYLLFLDKNFITISVLFYLKLSISIIFIYTLVNSTIWLKYKDFILYLLIGFAVLNTIIGLAQFIIQTSLGLNILGESPLSILSFGVAKIVAHETTFIRIYGLLPHPNILSGILVTISLLNLYLLDKVSFSSSRGVLVLSYILLVVGTCLTFSRGGIIALAFSTLVFLALIIVEKGITYSLKKFYFLPIAFIVIFAVFFPWYQNRTTVYDQAVGLRNIYNQAGIKIIKEKWLIGSGPGTNMLHMKQKLENKLPIWDIQPIHNYFLLIISELGLIGVGIIFYLASLVMKLITIIYNDIKSREVNSWRITLISITASVFILMQFDHYFYTNWSAQIILCFIIAWIIIETRKGITLKNVSHETKI